jgi:pyridoxamine 5'-phosphate oxidase-like protein
VTIQPARSAEQRKIDSLARIEADVDAWVASADAQGNAYLVPLSYVWNGTAMTMATPEASPTARNLTASGRVRLAIGPTRDVVLIEAVVEAFSRETVPVELADAFAAKLWDARLDKSRAAYFRVTPQRIQAWREANELKGRDLMLEGRWLV